MRLTENELYREDLKKTADLDLAWDKLSGKSLLLSGATGLIGSFITDLIRFKNERDGLGCRVIALGRSIERLQARFPDAGDDITFIQHDVADPYGEDTPHADFIMHLASNTHPMQYSTDPIGTITTNILGLKNLLDLAVDQGSERFLFASSVEIYGENRGDVERFDESYLGYIDCNTLRAGYPEGKRAGETLCQAYISQKNLDIVIPRLSRVYGPSMLMTDTKALSQFIKNGVNREDIVLKSEGNQQYSYTYAADAVSALLLCLLEGGCGEAYNISDEASDVTLKELAGYIAEHAGKKVVFDLPSETERAGYSTATKAMLDPGKIKALGWRASYDIRAGLARTIDILRELGD